jgi:hypothetical protein
VVGEAGVEQQSRAERLFLREGFNDSLCDLSVEEGAAEAAFFCECADAACNEFQTLRVVAFKEARAAGRSVRAEGHRAP